MQTEGWEIYCDLNGGGRREKVGDEARERVEEKGALPNPDRPTKAARYT